MFSCLFENVDLDDMLRRFGNNIDIKLCISRENGIKYVAQNTFDHDNNNLFKSYYLDGKYYDVKKV